VLVIDELLLHLEHLVDQILLLFLQGGDVAHGVLPRRVILEILRCRPRWNRDRPAATPGSGSGKAHGEIVYAERLIYHGRSLQGQAAQLIVVIIDSERSQAPCFT
jgi:hypothetical protein